VENRSFADGESMLKVHDQHLSPLDVCGNFCTCNRRLTERDDYYNCGNHHVVGMIDRFDKR